MKEIQFIASRRSDWEAWDLWLKKPGRQKGKDQESVPEALNPITLENIGGAFRRLCHDLAIARSRQYSSVLLEELHHRVLAVYQRIYSTSSSRSSAVLDFIGGGFPRLVRREWRFVLTAFLLFFVPVLLMLIAAQYAPDSVYLVLTPQQLTEMRNMYSPESTHLGRPLSASNTWQMWGYYIFNNVRINFQCFAGGLAFGLGSLFFVVYNGLVIGSVAGHLTQIGYIETFWGFVAGHSAFELTGIVLSGAAGLKLGMGLIAPGRLSRGASLKQAARESLGLIYGAAALTFLAAFIEAFWSPMPDVPFMVKVGVGVAFWIVTWAYLLLAGRGHRAA